MSRTYAVRYSVSPWRKSVPIENEGRKVGIPNVTVSDDQYGYTDTLFAASILRGGNGEVESIFLVDTDTSIPTREMLLMVRDAIDHQLEFHTEDPMPQPSEAAKRTIPAVHDCLKTPVRVSKQSGSGKRIQLKWDGVDRADGLVSKFVKPTQLILPLSTDGHGVLRNANGMKLGECQTKEIAAQIVYAVNREPAYEALTGTTAKYARSEIERAGPNLFRLGAVGDHSLRSAGEVLQAAIALAQWRAEKMNPPDETCREFARKIVEGPGGLNAFAENEYVADGASERVQGADWALRCLSNPYCAGSAEALRAVMERRAEKGKIPWG